LNKYYPFHKSDFRDYWYNEDDYRLETFKIIRQLTNEEKDGFAQGDDYDEEMYLIENRKGEQFQVFDTDILKECEISTGQYYDGLIHIIQDLEFSELSLKEFIEQTNIIKYIKENY
jgi:hypothetical protein